MSASSSVTPVSGVTDRTDPSALAPRWVRLLRVIVLMLSGLFIAFTAALHEDFNFDFLVTAFALGAIGVVHVVEWFARSGSARTVIPLLLGIIALAATALLPVSGTVLGYAVVLAAWALISGLLEFVGMVVRPGSRQDGAIVGGAGVLLALAVLLFRTDIVAILGFFGAYTIIAGVFLGIAAFDAKRGQTAPANA